MLDAFVAPPGPQTQKVQWDKANWLCWWFKKKMGGVERKKQVDNKKKRGGEGRNTNWRLANNLFSQKGKFTENISKFRDQDELTCHLWEPHNHNSRWGGHFDSNSRWKSGLDTVSRGSTHTEDVRSELAGGKKTQFREKYSIQTNVLSKLTRLRI